MDISTVDDMLLNSFGMADLGPIDIDKYQKGIFSSSPKNTILPSSPGHKVTSPQKSLHVVPQFPQQPPTNHHHMQMPRPHGMPSQIHNQQQQMHRKIHLGPHFDRLGILNQANEIPPMTAPFFAKALQQHGGTTLGAILQAHQHAMQQHMQRENFMLQHHAAQTQHHQQQQQQQQQQQIYQTVPMNNMYHHQHQQQQQQHRMNSMMMERRTDDQIVPNAQVLPPTENWLHHGNSHNYHGKPVRTKEENGVTNFRHVKQPPENYVIFNDENRTDEIMSDEEEKYNAQIRPPKNSIFVRYMPESNRCLPSFSEAFSGHIDKLKLKEEHLRQMLARHHEIHNQQFLLRREDVNREQELYNKATFTPPVHVNLEEKIEIAKDIKVEEISDESVEIKASEQNETNKETETVSAHAEDEKIENKESVPAYSHLEFLNDSTKDTNELFSYYENTKDVTSSEQPDATSIHDQAEIFSNEDSKETNKATESIGMFNRDLDLNDEHHNYDNLFNGNSDEHYFQAFKENNLHLANDLNENQMDTGEDILKLLHSPLEFLNDKFLK